MHILWMRPRQHSQTLAHMTQNESRLAVSTIHIQMILIRCQNFHLASRDCRGIDKHAAPVIVRSKRVCELLLKGISGNTQNRRSRTLLTVILKPPERTAATGSREKGQFATPHNLERLIPYLKLTPAAGVVGACTEAKIRASPADVVADEAIS